MSTSSETGGPSCRGSGPPAPRPARHSSPGGLGSQEGSRPFHGGTAGRAAAPPPRAHAGSAHCAATWKPPPWPSRSGGRSLPSRQGQGHHPLSAGARPRKANRTPGQTRAQVSLPACLSLSVPQVPHNQRWPLGHGLTSGKERHFSEKKGQWPALGAQRWTFRIGPCMGRGLTDSWGLLRLMGHGAGGRGAGLKARWSWGDRSAAHGTELPELRHRSLTVTPHGVLLGPALSIFTHDFLHFKTPNRWVLLPRLSSAFTWAQRG